MIEMLHQLGWKAPDWVIVPGGNLGNSSSFGKAFDEMLRANFIKKAPKIAVIQAQGANPLYNSFISGDRTLKPVHANTRATAIKIGNPVSFDKAWFAVESTGGIVEQVSKRKSPLRNPRSVATAWDRSLLLPQQSRGAGSLSKRELSGSPITRFASLPVTCLKTRTTPWSFTATNCTSTPSGRQHCPGRSVFLPAGTAINR